MANQTYNYYASSYGGPHISSYPYSSRPSTASDRYSDASLLASSRYLSSDPALDRGGSSHYSTQADIFRFSTTEIAGGIGAASAAPWAGVDGFRATPAAVDPAMVSGMKRPAEALYYQSLTGTQNAIGQSEALFSTNTFAKHPRLETPSNLHNYPQRPGEKDCPHYMLTRTCNFGANCKFNHPLWVPEGGIPGWKEIPLIHMGEPLPERPGEPDCPYYMKTQRCKFGFRCKFNHPKGTADASASDIGMEDLQTPSAGQAPDSMEQLGSAVKDNELASGDSKPAKLFIPFTPALLHNSKGLPIRPGETDCPFYLRTGSCKYGATCRYNHPDINSINAGVPAALGKTIIPSLAANQPLGVLNPSGNFLPNMDPRLTQGPIAMVQAIYPQRPGQLECDFYMKTGQCKFGERCKFHHPLDRFAPTSQEQNVKLTLAGLPRREGTTSCPYYMMTSACKYGANCRFDHPPPGEAIAMATVQGSAAPPGEEDKDDSGTNEEEQ